MRGSISSPVGAVYRAVCQGMAAEATDPEVCVVSQHDPVLD